MKIGIIADDLTGANATGVRLSKQGFRTASMVFGLIHPEGDYDVVSVDTDSRYATPVEARRRVTQTVHILRQGGTQVFCKRIDSTFRGNVGAELDALLDVLGEETTAVVVPSFPDSGRITVGGYLLVNGIPLQRTDVAKDPVAPITRSHIPTLLKEQSRLPVGFIEMETVLEGMPAIHRTLVKQIQKGNRIIVLDAVTEEQIEQIAKAMGRIQKPLVPADPGPLSVAYIKTHFQSRQKGTKVLVTVGSVTPTTGRQLEHFMKEWDCRPVYVAPEVLTIGSDRRNEAMERAIEEALERSRHSDVILVTTHHPEQGLLDLAALAKEQGTSEGSLAKSITDGLAGISRRIIERSRGEIGGCFASGGDVTASLFAATGTRGIELLEEIQPLIAYGRFIGGYLDGIPIVTKGGMAGDIRAIDASVRHLKIELIKRKQPMKEWEG
ncbi:uncharacterized protein YgbK (DUF1537 family) [Melghirimyces profundicolus]|uniref:Uncharacterized protein YgbK (DUF1537 family) n=1 Tax=Melghirimyces profundicolus TaxID=1242148 RepID=A0A2T6C8N6_9BACL|nr:four-carbon acid sugar kinase family protein [Melghirimyces profundicolus]PTX64681.1 uncharacterized protein YgbK (DUF1537 family) [Melghirimyces profundicolus]